MKVSFLRFGVPAVFAGLLAASAVAAPVVPHYHLLQEIPVGGDGGWDYLTVDDSARRLYVSHATRVVVIDLEKNAVVGEIPDTPGVHGIAVASDLMRGFTSNGRENQAGIVDLTTLRTVAKVETGANPDAMLYVPAAKEVYMFNGRGQSATVFEAASGKVTATIPLGGKPEFAVEDAAAGRVYCNIEDTNELVAIDPVAHAVTNRWPIAPGKEATGLAIDAAHHRLFLGCSNQLLVMLDGTDGRVVATVAIGAGVDATAFDPATQLAFSSNGEGTVTIAHEDSPEKLTVVQTLTTERGARTMTLDPKTHRLYLGSAKYEPAPAPTAETPRPRPKLVAGSFKVLVYGPE